MDLNSLFHGALKVAELTNFPKDRVCLVHEPVAMEVAKAGVEFAGAGLFVALLDENTVEVIVEMGTATWIQPLDRMCGKYNNLKLALTAAGMIIAGCDMMEPIETTLCAKTHINNFPNRHTVVTVENNSFGEEK